MLLINNRKFYQLACSQFIFQIGPLQKSSKMVQKFYLKNNDIFLNKVSGKNMWKFDQNFAPRWL